MDGWMLDGCWMDECRMDGGCIGKHIDDKQMDR